MIDQVLHNSNDRRIVVSATNGGYADFADNFANSLVRAGVSNFVLVPLDQTAHDLLETAYPGHVLPVPTDDALSVVDSVRFGSSGFKQLTAGRPAMLKTFLEKGYTVFYNDVDIVWRSNAWLEVEAMELQHAQRLGTTNDLPMVWHDGWDFLCSCMLYLTPAPYSWQLLDLWEREILSDVHSNDQPAFNAAAKSVDFFPNGTLQVNWFSEAFPSSQQFFSGQTGDTNKAVLVHNNFILGKDAKLERFKKFGLWNPSGRLPSR